MNIKLIATFLILVFFIACSKDSNDKITISGITERSNEGLLIGEVDETDWTNDISFPDEVYSLFNFKDTLDYSNASVSAIQVYEYPNPVDNCFYLRFSSSQKTVVKFIIVDESLKVYVQQSLKLNSGCNFLAIQTEELKSKYYRVYYAFYDKTQTIYFKGHGDIKKN